MRRRSGGLIEFELAIQAGGEMGGALGGRSTAVRKAWMAAGELLEKLAALVPPPRLNLVRYHGVLAPAAADRAQIVPGPSPLTQPEGCEHDDAAGAAGRHVQRICWAKLLARVFQYDVTVCPRCSGHMTVIAALTESAAIQAFLTAVGLPPRAPPIAPPRLDRQLEFDEAA